jgi:predicted dehydrogenase
MVRFAILGAGNIAHRFAASLAHDERASLVAASCRSVEKAESFLAEVPHAEEARAYGSYAELLADPGVDAIYLALPHVYHRKWAIAALRAGKAVLCEKPACVSAAEMSEIADIARAEGMLFMEAMKPRFVPLYPLVMEALPSIGELLEIRASLCNDMLEYVEASGSYHMTPGPGAGVVLDCGTYCASWIAALCPADMRLDSLVGAQKNDIDVYADATFRLGALSAHLECAFDRAKPRQATIVGTRGTIVVDELHRPQRATVRMADGRERVIEAPYEVDDFFGELSHFVSLVEAGTIESPIMSLDDSLRCAELLDAVRAGFVTL